MTENNQVLVIMPTYNEADNIETMTARLLSVLPQASLLVVDDGSPDGTGEIADCLAAADQRVQVLHRSVKAGLATAYVTGFKWGLERNFDVLVEMDADGSHQPEELPRLLAALEEADMVKGSRWTRGGTVVDWTKRRQWLSRGANIWIQVVMDLPIHDSTGGYNLYRAGFLRTIDLDDIAVTGYAFQIDMTRRVIEAGGVVREVPIEFQERLAGQSKMDTGIMVEALQQTVVWGAQKRAAQLKDLLAKAYDQVRPLTEKIVAQAARGFRLPD